MARRLLLCAQSFHREGFLKRIAAIVVITALILTMSVGSAYAAACVGMVCSPSSVAHPMMPTSACPEMGGETAVMHGVCDHHGGSSASTAVAVQPAMSEAVAAQGVPAPLATRQVRAPRASVSGDARGAPHLTSVIRI